MIVMSEIKRNKGMIEFWVDDKKKPYVFDINKGEILGLRGSALQTIPSVVRHMARQSLSTAPSGVMRLIYNGYMKTGWYIWADRLDNIGYHPTVWELDCYYKDLDNGFNLGKFVKWFKENPNQSLDDYLRSHRKSEWLKETGLQADEILNERMIDWIYDSFRHQPVENIKVIAYWLSRGVWEYHNGESYLMRRRIEGAIEFATAINTPLEKSDFFRQYINLKRAYQHAQDEKANRLMREYQEYHRNAMTFETDTHIVLIPTTIEELRNEGQAQGNCVGGYGNSIANKRLNVVFIRRKSNPTKSYITCDIDRSGYINQYLTACNNFVSNEQDLDFKKLFQAHLLANWNMSE